MRWPLLIPTHALAPALDSEGMTGSAKFFVLFSAKISYAGMQGAEDLLASCSSLAVMLNLFQHLFIARVSYVETLKRTP